MKRKPDLNDIIFFAGLGSLAYGLYLISLSLCLIVIGVLLIVFGLYSAWINSSAVTAPPIPLPEKPK